MGVRNENDPGGLEPTAGGKVVKPGPWWLLPGGQTFDEDVLCLSESCVLLELCSPGAPDCSRMERWLSWSYGDMTDKANIRQEEMSEGGF